MKLKKGDTVQIITGKDAGKSGKILSVQAITDRIIVDGLNMKSKAARPKRMGEKGQIVAFAAPLHASNVKMKCPKCGKPTRVSFARDEGGKKSRACKKCKEIID